MTELPIVERPTQKRPGRLQTAALHSYRVILFLVIIAAIHQQHRWYVAQQRGDRVQALVVDQVTELFPDAKSLGPWDPDHGGQTVLDADEKELGFVVQTFPEADRVIGFSGPTNTLLAFGPDKRILGMSVLHSGDTREHTRDVVENERFMTSLNGLNWQAASQPQVDAVSGATLTSLAIIDGIARRLGGANPSSRFPELITVEEAKAFFPEATGLTDDPQKPSLQIVQDAQGTELGKVLRTSPHADNMIGYQGPTDTLIALDPEHRIVGAAIRHSFDNEPYVRYVKEDEYFFNIFKGFSLADIAELDVVDAGIEGVSGATKTSTQVAEALIHTAAEVQAEQPIVVAEPPRWYDFSPRDYGTAIVVLLALLLALTHLRGKRWLRIGFQVVLIVYLGFINADMVSQALLVGWAQNGVAWQVAPGLVLLTAAALACPIFTGRQVYCTHLCPFGAAQDWLRRVPLRAKFPRWIDRTLRLLPALLLIFVVVVAMMHLPISLVGIEPFDAFVIRIAGWATLSVAVVGLVVSAFVPMAYCHYGCPTGAMLRFLRWHGGSGRFTRGDLFVTALAAVAIGIYLS
ncbi:FMN-binding protein [Rosistilla carotiformis]|nr:FMN-binding protein [Rosistilla carotiformis]